MMVGFRLLGSVRVTEGARELPIGHARQVRLLALLLLEMNNVVPVTRISDLLWDGGPPRTARNVIAGYATRLRKALREGGVSEDEAAIRSRAGGYVVEADPAALDLSRFRRLRADAAQTGDDERAVILLREAMTLWRGPALGGLAGRKLEALLVSLEQERIAATLECCDAELRLGRPAYAVPDLLELADAAPLDEQVAARLVTAQYEAGNPAGAMESFARIKGLLSEELGITPGEALSAVAARIRKGGPADENRAAVAASAPGRGDKIRSAGAVYVNAFATAGAAAAPSAASAREPVLTGSAGAWPEPDPAFQGAAARPMAVRDRAPGLVAEAPSTIDGAREGHGRSGGPYGIAQAWGAPGGDPFRLNSRRLLSLPAGPEHVVGLDRLVEFNALTGPEDRHSDASNLLIVDGVSRTGKTNLVLRWARIVRSRFPDGQFFLNLRCHDPHLKPVAPADALARCLQALGVPVTDIPFGLEQRAAVYRTLLADRRLLLLLDDAAAEEQVRPLMPPSDGGSVVVVTCRHRLPSLTARYRARTISLSASNE